MVDRIIKSKETKVKNLIFYIPVHYFWLEEGWSVGVEDGEGDNSEGQNTLDIFVNIWQERTNPEEKVNQVSELVNR